MTGLENDDQKRGLTQWRQTVRSAPGSPPHLGCFQHAAVEEAALLLGQAVSAQDPPHWCAFPAVSFCHVVVLQSPRLAARQSWIQREPYDLYFQRISFCKK